jgi:hypothetical protein
LNCTTYGSGSPHIASALWIPCRGPSYRALAALGLVCFSLYAAGSLAVMAFRLRPGSAGTSAVSRFLRSPYTDSAYFWEAVQLLRRILLAAVGALSPLHSLSQPVLVSCILILSLFAHTWVKPFARARDNLLESTSLILLLASFLAGLISANPTFAPSARSIVSWLFFSLNALFILSLTCLVLFSSTKSLLDRSSSSSSTTTRDPLLAQEEDKEMK